MTAYVGLTNLLKTATITVTSTAVGYDKENLKSYKTSSWWQANAAGTVYVTLDLGSAMAADCWGIVGHNLTDNSGTIKPQHSTDNFAANTADFDTIQTPTENEVIFRKVSSATKRYWRFEIASTAVASFIANLFIGVAQSLEREMGANFSPANLNRVRKIFNNKTATGQYTGRVLRAEGAKVLIDQRLVTKAWIDANWTAMANHVELYPFYFIWNQETYPTQAGYLMANRIRYPKYRKPLHLDFSIDCGAMYDV